MSYGDQAFNNNQINICYQILELEPGASWEQVKQAYKELALVWHPDRFTQNPSLQQKAQERLKRINKAYEILKAYYRQQYASASKSVAEPPPPPPPPSTNSQNYTSDNNKTTKEAKLSLAPKDIIRETQSIIMPNYIPLISMLIPQFLLVIILIFIQHSKDALISLFLLLAYIFTWLSGQGAIALYIYQKLKNKSISITSAINESIGKFPQILGTTILYWITVLIGIICFLIPGLYLGFSLIFYLQIIVREKSSVIKSLKRSWEIVKGHRKIIFWNLLILNCLISQVNRMTWSDNVFISLLGQLINLFSLPYAITYHTVIYKRIVDFKNKGENSEAVSTKYS